MTPNLLIGPMYGRHGAHVKTVM